MDNYTHATEFHLQGEQLTKALNSAKQAELIALQLGLLNQLQTKTSTFCLLDLNNSQIISLITTHLEYVVAFVWLFLCLNSVFLSFEQALLLVEAYNFHPDWALVLYEQYVVKNNTKYFYSFLQHLPLTETLVYDISRRFITSNVRSTTENRCMKNIVTNLPSLHMKYRIASELGFTDLVQDLLASGQLVYLKDTVWKKGYKD